MDIAIERQLHDLILRVIQQGRWLAEDWLEGSLVPSGTSKRLVLDTLKDLREHRGIENMDRDLMDLLQQQIRRALNELIPGKGDAAFGRQIDTEWEQDPKIVEYVRLAERWKKFRSAKVAVDDKLAAIRAADRVLSRQV